MSDFFGISTAVKSSLLMYQTCARGSGRTLAMVNSLKNGDRVVFCSEKEARRVTKLAKNRGVKLDYLVIDPKAPQGIFRTASSRGRTIFDHSWVEQYFLNAIERAERDIHLFQTEASGYGEPHVQTKLRAQELLKFRMWEEN